MIFDSKNPTGGDPDLQAPGVGMILIYSEDGDTSDPDDGIGGSFTFDFSEVGEAGLTVESIVAVDTEEGGTIKLYDSSGEKIGDTIDVPDDKDDPPAGD